MNDLPYDERELLSRIADGDEKAFYLLYKIYAPRIRTYVRKFTHSLEDTEELIQESFMRIWLHRDKLTEVRNLQSWIYRLAANNCLNLLRKQHNDKKKMSSFAVTGQTVLPPEPLSVLQQNEIRRLAQQAVLTLNTTRKNIYLLNREQGMSPAEIGKHLGMPVGTVKNNLTAAIREVRKCLEVAGYHVLLFILVFVRQ